MAVRLLPDDVREERSRTLQALHAEWAAGQVAAGVDGPVPAGRRELSDYNVHVPDLEADGAALDDFWDRAGRVLDA